MLSHSDFPVRMVQWGEERSFCTDHKSRLHDHLIQLELIYFRQPFLTHSSPQERDLYLGRIKFLYTWSRSFRGKPNWVRQLKKTEQKRSLLEQGLLPPSFPASFARSPTSFPLGVTSSTIQWGAEISSPILGLNSAHLKLSQPETVLMYLLSLKRAVLLKSLQRKLNGTIHWAAFFQWSSAAQSNLFVLWNEPHFLKERPQGVDRKLAAGRKSWTVYRSWCRGNK